MSFRYKAGTTIYLDLDSHFYKDSYGERKWWSIRSVYNDAHEHFTINRVVDLNRKCPYHIKGKYGDLGWVSPYAIRRKVEFEFSY